MFDPRPVMYRNIAFSQGLGKKDQEREISKTDQKVGLDIWIGINGWIVLWFRGLYDSWLPI